MQTELESVLRDVPLGGLKAYPSTGSTNDDAMQWALRGAPDFSCVVAGEQTAGRGRAGRQWITPPDAALAFSIILRQVDPKKAPFLTALGALAAVDALRADYGLPAQIKWPNDVLVGRRKLGGILVEAVWQAERFEAAVLGIGLNVSRLATAGLDPALLAFPAASVEEMLGRPVERWELLRSILLHVHAWRPRLGSAEFLKAWEDQLAMRGEWVQLVDAAGDTEEVQVLGINKDGNLRVLPRRAGSEKALAVGEIRLRSALS